MREVYPEILIFLCTLFLTVGATAILLPILRKKHIGQHILEIGPSWHLGKAGTPTMGGLAFVLVLALTATGVSLFWFYKGEKASATALVLIAVFGVASGAIGAIDDFKKLAKKENQGLTAAKKYLLQLAAAAVFLALSVWLLRPEPILRFPFSDKTWELGFFYYPLALIFLTGMMNACNLTDGVDGLLSSVVALIAAALFLLGLRGELVFFRTWGALLLGASLGFLLFNAHPARLFMGDTGSLAFGGILGAFGVLTGEALLLLLFGFMLVFETTSVILQVTWFKISGGKRLFLMAPYHHHLEKRGCSENMVVGIFCFVTAILSAVGVILWNG